MADPVQQTFAPINRDSEAIRTFGYRLYNQYTVNKAYRRAKELEWLECLRQYKGLYDPDIKIEDNCSKVYPKLTRSKVNIVLSRLHEMLFPETDKNWEIEPTPEPKIDKERVKQIAKSLIVPDPENPNVLTPPSMDTLNLAIKEYSKTACEKMSTEIDDQFTEMNYPEETKKVLRSGLMYGTGIMKGPLTSSTVRRKWRPVNADDYEEIEEQDDSPLLKFTRLWDWYPDMSTDDYEKMDGSFERHVMTKHDLRKLAKRSDFYGDVILKYLSEHPNGDYVPENWEIDLQVIEVEAGSKESTTVTSSSAANLDTQNRTSYRMQGNKFEFLEFWGYVDGKDLEACGVNVDDPALEYGANIWILGRQVVKAKLFPGAVDMYKVFYYEKDETSIFGEGLCRIMRHSQMAISGAARMVLDNGACVAGPQVEVNWDLLAPWTDCNSFYPRKIWVRKGRGIDSQYDAIRPIQFDSHITELLSIIDTFKQFGDEETTLPTWMIGQLMNNETAQATSGRQSQITVSIKDVVKNFDAFTERILRDMYAWNMDFNPRPEIKGDFKCKARGVSSLVMKEIRMQALNQFIPTLSVEDWAYIPRRELLSERLEAHDIRLKLRSEEEAQQILASQQDQRAQELAYQQMEADIAYKKAQTASQLTKAKHQNVEATIAANTPPESPTPGADPRLNDAELMKKQAEIEDKNAKTQIAREKHQAEMMKTAHDMAVKEHESRANLENQAAKTKHDMDLKEKTVQHGMKLKETATKEGLKIKKTMASKPKPAAKPKSSTK